MRETSQARRAREEVDQIAALAAVQVVAVPVHHLLHHLHLQDLRILLWVIQALRKEVTERKVAVEKEKYHSEICECSVSSLISW